MTLKRLMWGDLMRVSGVLELAIFAIGAAVLAGAWWASERRRRRVAAEMQARQLAAMARGRAAWRR